MDQPLDFMEMAQSLNVLWEKTTDSTLEMARLCWEINGLLSGSERVAFFPHLRFNAATFCKLSKIGERAALYSADIKPQLPSSYSVLYEITHLNDREFEAATEAGIIRPDMTRQDIIDWRKARIPSIRNAKERLFGQVLVQRDLDETQSSALFSKLDEVVASFPGRFVKKLTPSEDAHRKADARMHRTFRKLAREYIKKRRKEAMNGNGRWSLGDDEVEIADGMTLEECKYAFVSLGAEDTYENFLRQVQDQYFEEMVAFEQDNTIENVCVAEEDNDNSGFVEPKLENQKFDEADQLVSRITGAKG